MTSEIRWSEIVQAIEAKYDRLDILVSNAGIGIAVAITDMTLADWRRQTAVNLDGVFLSVKYCIPAMRRAGGGSIIMMSSLAGLRGAAGLTGYCATKGGVRLFAKAVAMECAQAQDNIRVNSVHPGIIDTPIWGKIPTGAEQNRSNAPIDPHERARDAAPLARDRPRAGHRQRRVVPRLGGVELHDRRRDRHRRRHERRRRRAAGVASLSAASGRHSLEPAEAGAPSLTPYAGRR